MRNLKFLIIKNTSFQFAAQISSTVIGFVVNAMLSRYLGVDGYGKYNYVFAFYAFFLTLNDLGVNTILIREISRTRGRAEELIHSLLTLKLFIAVMSLLVAWNIIPWMNLSEDMRKSLYFYALILPILACQMPLVIFQVDLEIGAITAAGMLNRCFQFILLGAAVMTKQWISGLIAALIIADGCFIPIYWMLVRKKIKFGFSANISIWKLVLKSSLPIAISGFIGLLTNQISFIFLQRLSTPHELGLFSAVFRVTTLFQMIPLMVMTSIYPLMSKYAGTDPAMLKRLFLKCQAIFIAAGILMGILVTLTASLIIRVVFGGKFLEAVPGLQIMIWSTVLLYMSITAGNFLISIGKEKVSLLTLSVAGIVNVSLSFLLIPSHGYIGAAWATDAALLAIAGITLAAAHLSLKHQIVK